MKQLTRSEFNKRGTTYKSVTSPATDNEVTQITDIVVKNNHLSYSTNGSTFTQLTDEVQFVTDLSEVYPSPSAFPTMSASDDGTVYVAMYNNELPLSLYIYNGTTSEWDFLDNVRPGVLYYDEASGLVNVFIETAPYFSVASYTKTSQLTNDANFVNSTELATELETKQDVLTFDSTPTDNSQNPVTSDGIYEAFVSRKTNLMEIYDLPSNIERLYLYSTTADGLPRYKYQTNDGTGFLKPGIYRTNESVYLYPYSGADNIFRISAPQGTLFFINRYNDAYFGCELFKPMNTGNTYLYYCTFSENSGSWRGVSLGEVITQLPFLNSSSVRMNTSSSFYAPTSGGTSGQFLKANGTNQAPTWVTTDSTPTQNSANIVSSGGVYTALSGKQDTLSQAQLDAVNSGVTSSTVSQVATNTTDIAAKYTKPSGGIPKTDLASGVQDSLDLADSALQSISSSDVTTALGYTPYNSTNPNGYTKVESSSTNGNIKINGSETTVYTLPNNVATISDVAAVSNRVTTIEGEIPSQASSSNQLADKAFVNSSINALAAYYITKNAAGDPFATKAELNAATTFYSGGVVRVPTTNDYCIVLADESKQSETGVDPTTRYSYQGNQWEYQYTINDTPLTAAQLAALNSGITSSLVTQIDTNTTAIAGKQDTIDSSNKLDADLVDDTSTTNKFVTSTDITNWNGKQNALSTAQMNAVNSGVTSSTVSQVATNTSDISGLQTSKQNAITSSAKLSADLVDDTSTTNKFVTSSDISNWNAKQNALTFDSTPTSNSSNPVTSGGVYTALGKKGGVYRGTFGNWSTVPSSASGYEADANGNTTPLKDDYMILNDGSGKLDDSSFLYLSDTSGSRASIANTYNGNTQSVVYYNATGEGNATTLNGVVSVYFNSNTGKWVVKTLKACTFNSTTYAVGDIIAQWGYSTYAQGYIAYEANTNGGIFVYDGVWSTDGKNGWETAASILSMTTGIQNAINTKQDAITSTNKLDYSLIANTPTIPTTTSSVTQGSTAALTSGGAYTALSGKQDTLTAGTGITISNNVISSNASVDNDEKVQEISTQYIRITDLDAGVYRLTYNGTKYIYYNGASATDTHTVTGADGVVVLVVSMYSTSTRHWYYINGSSSYATIYFGYTTSTAGSVSSKALNDVLTSATTSSITSGSTALITSGGVYTGMQNKMDKANPTGTGSFSLNRRANTTVGTNSVAVGNDTTASGVNSFAGGTLTRATGRQAHAEGYATTASNDDAHAEGYGTTASGEYSHAEGYFTKAQCQSQHVFGEYNVLDSTGSTSTRGAYVEIVGNGTASDALSNARTLDWSGNEVLAGTLQTTGLKDGNNANYKLVMPDSTSWTADKTIATTDQIVNSSTDVQVNGTSITSNNVANLVTNTAYNATSNKIATMSDIPTVNNATLTVQLNGSTVNSFTANASSNVTANIQALPNYSITINHNTAGNPRQVKFLSVNYTNYTSNSAAYFKLGAMSCHGNGSSYQFLEDIIIGVSSTGTITAQLYKYCQADTTLDNVTRYYGDVFYTHDTTAKVVDFYILCGQYASSQFTPFTKIGSTTTSGITQYSGTATYYSSGTKVWATGDSATYVRSSDLATVATTGSYNDLSNKLTFDTAPTSGSTNPVTSGGVYTAIQNAASTSAIVDLIYPIGSYFITESSSYNTAAKVAAHFGGTWTQVTGRFLYGSSSAGSIGGSNDATLVSHNHTFTGTKVSSSFGYVGNTRNNMTDYTSTDGAGNQIFTRSSKQTGAYYGGGGRGNNDEAVIKWTYQPTGTISTEGSSATNANMPAYRTVYMYRRTG